MRYLFLFALLVGACTRHEEPKPPIVRQPKPVVDVAALRATAKADYDDFMAWCAKNKTDAVKDQCFAEAKRQYDNALKRIGQ